MANKRMFTMSVVDSDAFLDMPLSTQALYFHLNMRADDDGFIGNPKRVQRIVGASDDDLKLLLMKRFLLAFEDGVMVIKHWRMHNTIRHDRYTPTPYQDELSKLVLKENKSYTIDKNIPRIQTNAYENGMRLPSGCQNVIPNVIPTVTTGLGLGLDLDLDKEKDIVQTKSAPSVSKAEINDLFERVWKLYPAKKGKGQVKDAQKKRLFDIGYEELERAITRYKKELEKDSDWRKPQNGSTFFNSGYVDYMDANYEEQQAKEPTAKKNSRDDWNDGALDLFGKDAYMLND